MEMVAAAKMRQAIEAVLKTRPYANLSWATVLDLARTVKVKGGETLHPLLALENPFSSKAGAERKVAIILVTSNRGLCGGFNSNIIKKALEEVKRKTSPSPSFVRRGTNKSSPYEGEEEGEVKYEFILLGKKGAVINKNFGLEVAADFPKMDYMNEIKEVIPAARMAVKDYLAGKYDKVMVVYTDYINAVKQLPRVKQILPVDLTEIDKHLGAIGGEAEKKDSAEVSLDFEYVFEPSPEEVLSQMLPRLIEIQLFQAILESSASENSARRFAMHQATEAASDMVGELTLSYNKARQAGITSEIAEISAGANALAE